MSTHVEVNTGKKVFLLSVFTGCFPAIKNLPVSLLRAHEYSCSGFLFIACIIQVDFKFGFAALQHSRDEGQAQAAFFAKDDALVEFVHAFNIVLAGDLLEARKRNIETHAARYHKNKKTQNPARRNSRQRNFALLKRSFSRSK
jgi:hypothetical protein